MSTPFELNLSLPTGFTVKRRDFIGHSQEATGRPRTQDRIIMDILIQESTGKEFIRCRDIRCENTNPQEDKPARPSGFGISPGIPVPAPGMPRPNIFDPRPRVRQPQFKRRKLTRREQQRVDTALFKQRAAQVIKKRKARKKKLTARKRRRR